MNAKFNDIDQLFETIPWQGDFIQLDRGSLEAHVDLAIGDDVSVMRTSFNRAFDQRGVAPGYGRTFGFRARSEAAIQWCNQAFLDSTLVIFPEDGSFEAWSGPGFEVFVVTVDATALSAAATLCELSDGFGAITSDGAVHDCRSEDMEALRIAVAGMFAGVVRPNTGGRDLEFEIARLVLTALDRDQTVIRPPQARIRDRAITSAVELIRSGGAQDLSVPELCRTVGASERTLRYAFAERTGLSPQSYMKTVRLARVRAALRTLDSTAKRGVGDVAAQWGFWHMGQFARDYRQMFGELPSATLSCVVADTD